MDRTIETAFFARRADAARALSILSSLGIEAVSVSLVDSVRPDASALGIRHPAAVEAADEARLSEWLCRADAIVLAGGITVTGPLSVAVGESLDHESPSACIVRVLAGAGVGAYEAGYLAAGLATGGTLLAIEADPAGAAGLRDLLDRAGGRGLHAARERPPAMRA